MALSVLGGQPLKYRWADVEVFQLLDESISFLVLPGEMYYCFISYYFLISLLASAGTFAIKCEEGWCWADVLQSSQANISFLNKDFLQRFMFPSHSALYR